MNRTLPVFWLLPVVAFANWLSGGFATGQKPDPVAAKVIPPAVVVPIAVGAKHGGTPQPLGNEMPCKTGYVDPESGGIPELFGGVGTDINGQRVATPRPTARAGGSGVRFP